MSVSEHVPYGSAYGVDHSVAQEALRDAAVIVLDEAFAALGEFWHHNEVESLANSHGDLGARRVFAQQASVDSDPFIVSTRLPDVYRSRYGTFDFLKNWVVTLSVVGWKLAQPNPLPLTNVAEELATHVLIEHAMAKVEDREPPSPEALESLRDLYEGAFEDKDFLVLYRLEDSDDLPDLDPHNLMGMADMRFKNWFLPFGSGADRGVPHPFFFDE